MNPIRQVAYSQFLGLPLILYGGIITLLSLITTAALGYLMRELRKPIPFIWHKRFAFITLGLALFHGLLGILSYL